MSDKIPAINKTLVDTMNDTDIQIDSSSPNKAPYANKWGDIDDELAFDNNLLNPFDIQKKKMNAAMEGMSAK